MAPDFLVKCMFLYLTVALFLASFGMTYCQNWGKPMSAGLLLGLFWPVSIYLGWRHQHRLRMVFRR